MKISKNWTSKLLTAGVFWAPLALAAVFYAFVASDRYVSTTVISVKDTGSSSSGGFAAAASSLLGGGTPSYSDVFYLQSYYRSSDLLERLDAKLKLRAHFSQPGADFAYRLSANASREEFLDYFRNRVEMVHDDLTGLVTLKAQGFDAAFAQKLAQAMVEEGDRFVNDSARRIAGDRLSFAENEVKRASEQVLKAKAELLAFQTRNKVLDVNSQAAATNAVTSNLQANLSRLEADLKTAQGFLSEDSMQVRSLRSQIAAAQAQLDSERLRSTTDKGGAQLPAQAMEYQALLTQAGFAEEMRKGAQAVLEQARMDTVRKLKAVVVIDPPSLPDEAAYPRRWYNWFTALALLGMLLAVVRLIVATIREHQD